MDNNETPRKREWVKPEVRKMHAGAAEDGAGGNPDGGLNS